MGDSYFDRFLQGGGVFIQGGSVTFDSCIITGNTATYVCAHAQNFPSPRAMGFSHVSRLCLQAGGVAVLSASVTFLSCTITGNSATSVRANAQKFPSPRWDFHMFCACACPDGKIADELASTHD